MKKLFLFFWTILLSGFLISPVNAAMIFDPVSPLPDSMDMTSITCDTGNEYIQYDWTGLAVDQAANCLTTGVNIGGWSGNGEYVFVECDNTQPGSNCAFPITLEDAYLDSGFIASTTFVWGPPADTSTAVIGEFPTTTILWNDFFGRYALPIIYITGGLLGFAFLAMIWEVFMYLKKRIF